MSDRQFEELAAFVTQNTGIRMPITKRTLLEARLRRRLVALGIDSYEQYCRLLFQDMAGTLERQELIDAVTTNKTEFFREPQHFHYLTRKAIPSLLGSRLDVGRRRLHVWSAGCASGEEPYSLAMVLAEASRVAPGFEHAILATDISRQVLQFAARGVYPDESVSPIPFALRTKYLLKSRDRRAAQVRIRRDLRQRIRFSRHNMVAEDLSVSHPIDVVFCRNVLIYFDDRVRRTVLGRFCRQLRPGGYVFVGHCESVSSLGLPLKAVAPAVMRRVRS